MHSDLIQLSPHSIRILQNGKNILAFSGGVDSSALFFILQHYNIDFHVAIVDYGIRIESKKEVQYAIKLCHRYNKQCYILECSKIESSFEFQARLLRYTFFRFLISTYHYHNLIMAHHFDDKLEWFFMRFSHGAGLNTLLGFQEIENCNINTQHYYLMRPLINYTKYDLLQYNHAKNILFYLDESNQDSKYLRNFFRNNFTLKLSKKFTKGIKRSLDFLLKERLILYPSIMICCDMNLFYCKAHQHEMHTIDVLVKRFGYVMSEAQKNEVYQILVDKKECVLGDKIVIAKNDSFIYVGVHTQWIFKKIIDRSSYMNDGNDVVFPKNIENLLQYLIGEEKDTVEQYLVTKSVILKKNTLYDIFSLSNIITSQCYFYKINNKKQRYEIIVSNTKNNGQVATQNHDVDSMSINHKLTAFFLSCYLPIPKKQRDIYRLSRIPPKIRAIMYLNSLDIWK